MLRNHVTTSIYIYIYIYHIIDIEQSWPDEHRKYNVVTVLGIKVCSK